MGMDRYGSGQGSSTDARRDGVQGSGLGLGLRSRAEVELNPAKTSPVVGLVERLSLGVRVGATVTRGWD